MIFFFFLWRTFWLMPPSLCLAQGHRCDVNGDDTLCTVKDRIWVASLPTYTQAHVFTFISPTHICNTPFLHCLCQLVWRVLPLPQNYNVSLKYMSASLTKDMFQGRLESFVFGLKTRRGYGEILVNSFLQGLWLWAFLRRLKTNNGTKSNAEMPWLNWTSIF